MRRLGLILLFLASCGQERRPSPPPPDNPGLKTRLILLGDEFAVGKPLKVRLELTNESAWPMIGSAQGVDRGFLITGPDGKRVPNIDLPRQTAGGNGLLKPGETVVLSDERDLEPYHLITRPGRYQIQFLGGGLRLIDAREVPLLAQLAAGIEPTVEDGDRWFAESDKLSESSIRLPSNIVTVELKPGRPRESSILAERLLTILPEGWHLGVDDLAEDGEVRIRLQKLPGLISEIPTVEVVSSARVLEKLGERVCAWDGRNVYASANPNAVKLWPNYRPQVAKALAP